jgi:phosphoglycolate phosphatase-like HAD superfamily hydrolase
VLFDADGVLLDSSCLAYAAARDILSLFGEAPRVDDGQTYIRHFDRDAQVRLAGEDGAAALRAMHRVLMRHRCDGVRPFTDVIEVVRRLTVPAAIVSGAYADGIRRALGKAAAIFCDVVGRERGPKSELLAKLGTGRSVIYICDTVKDVLLCQRLGVPCVAVTWGYDPAIHLASCGPDYLVGSAAELVSLLRCFGAIRDHRTD